MEKKLLLLSLILITGCTKSPTQENLPQDKFIQAYFNHRETKSKTYQDPYRQIEREGDNLEAIIIEEIEGAKSSIDLAVQELNLPLIAQALVESSKLGVKIRIILDNNYSRPLSSLTKPEIKRLKQRDRSKYDEFFALADLDGNGSLNSSEIKQRDALIILKNAGIEIIDDTADGSKGSGLMHHKFMVVDRQTVILGSANFTLSGIHGDFKNLDTKGNINHLLRINNSQVAKLFTEEFNYMWSGRFGLAKPQRSPVSLTWDQTKVTLQFAPTSSSKDWHLSTNGLIEKIINNANSSIDLSLFVFSEGLISKKLQQKQQQGVTIRGVFDPSFAFRYYSEVLDLLGVVSYYRCQEEADNNPWTRPLETIGVANLELGDKLHHKFALIDQQIVISGSPNWSQAANHQNDEALIVINNFSLAQHFLREYQRLSKFANWGLPTTIKSKIERQKVDCQ